MGKNLTGIYKSYANKKSRYKNIIEWVLTDEELKDVYVLPQIHTLVWSNLQGK